MRRTWLSILAMLGLACSGGSGAAEMAERLMVAPETVPCTGVAPTSCLRVKKPGELDWQLLHGGIEGFTHEPGVAYLLLVRERRIDNPPADAPSRVWVLQEMVGRHPIPPDQAGVLETLRGTGWRPQRAQPAEPFGDAWRSSGLTLVFDKDTAHIYGHGGCNRWFGEWSVDGDGKLAAQPFGSTMMACPDPQMKLEAAYLELLHSAVAVRWWGSEVEVIARGGACLLLDQLLE
ncbi:MAG TPA: DUF4377 domain-containing protein [Geminicoccaceae bacterium]|nr:DUF4377 domain-containing protein [Geminicoccus sp.]HMU52493.1 DUF4377 domain-containing protein [Geminicoccaceae bacterium]